LAWLGSIAEVLDELAVPWVLAGALAADRYRAGPRYTADVDLLVEWDERLPEVLEQRGYDVVVVADPGSSPHLLRLRSATQRIDLIVADVAYQRLAIERGSADRVLTVEDVIVHKLISWRPKDRDDITSILSTGVEMDAAYLDEWVAAWDLTDRWAEMQRS
jgi:hypothetical protein